MSASGYSLVIAATLITLGIAIGPAYLALRRKEGVRRGAFAVRANGIRVFLEAEEGQYLAVARVCYRVPRGPLLARFRLLLTRGNKTVWQSRFGIDEAEVARGSLVERQVPVGRFDVEADDQYTFRVEPEDAADTRVHVASIELFSRLPKPHPIALAASQALIGAGLVTLALRWVTN
jgi:hypothetical protein